MAKIAYGIFAYKDPEIVIRLVKRLHADKDLIYIHFDTAIGEFNYHAWKKLIQQKCSEENIEIASLFRCKWGSFGLVDSILSAMKHFNDLDFDYFINLTGGCYPIKSAGAIKNEFSERNSIFMQVFEIPFSDCGSSGWMDRIQNRYYFISSKKYPYVRVFHIPRIRRKLPLKLKPYGGSGYFCLPKEVVEYVLEYVEKYPSVSSFFRRVRVPDEMFFQTILMNSHYSSRIVNDNKRYINWDRNTGSHPAILTKNDFYDIKSSGKLFARKFDPSIDSEVLDLIDQDIEDTEMLRNLPE
jgi:hypothetical protein